MLEEKKVLPFGHVKCADCVLRQLISDEILGGKWTPYVVQIPSMAPRAQFITATCTKQAQILATI
jgi:hypothetical protein